MKSQTHGAAALLIAALTLGGCTGLEQFPRTSKDYVGDLDKLDPDYLKALGQIEGAAGNSEQQKLLRDLEIDRRLRVIDLNFSQFRKGLARENVAVDFGVAIVAVGLGATGALVAETASQILSAVSGGLAGAQQAYSKAALYDQTLSALLAQMIASRKAVLVKIYEGRAQGIDVYPLSAAVKHLEAYEFAGSLPGAVVATSADAKVKNDQAQNQLDIMLDDTYEFDNASNLLRGFWKPDGKTIDAANKAKIDACMTKENLVTGPGTITGLITSKTLAPARLRVVKCLSP